VNSFFHQILVNPFTWGLVLGLVFVVLALYRIIRLKGEIKRYKRHLSDRLEIEAEAVQKKGADLERLKKENENLRVKIAGLNDFPEHRLERDLEIYARAEKRMVVGVPGFAGCWKSRARKAARAFPSASSHGFFPALTTIKLRCPTPPLASLEHAGPPRKSTPNRVS